MKFFKILKDTISISLVIITILISLSQIFFRDSTLFNAEINHKIELFNKSTFIYFWSIYLIIITSFLGFFGERKKVLENILSTPSIIYYSALQLYFSYDFVRFIKQFPVEREIFIIPLAMMPTIIYIIRRPLKRIMKLEKEVEKIMEKQV